MKHRDLSLDPEFQKRKRGVIAGLLLMISGACLWIVAPGASERDFYPKKVETTNKDSQTSSSAPSEPSPTTETLNPKSGIFLPALQNPDDSAERPENHSLPAINSYFGFAQLLQSTETEPDSKGRFLKVAVYNTDFKYPLIRVAEQWNGPERIHKRSAMVADHLIVKWHESADPIEIAELLEANSAQIRDIDPDSHISLISFEGYDPKNLGRMLKALQNSPLILRVEPDYLITNR